ncbi:hypothetical protein [Actinokineospora sp. UTMC 2448]|uniref:hypothetical protein n=1 Tax=Actinokineospora sp. UTMC 2448 TaxID=2268449 RepID=UPI002164CAD3|nr:hypothetical protein [Actinokineospora sp. UTMC 2448]
MIRDFVRDKAKTLPADDNAASVTAVRVWHCNYATLKDLSRYTNVRTLVVATYPDADLDPIAALSRLEYLHLVHLPKVVDLTPLIHLQQLRILRLETLPGWDGAGKVTTVKSLEPLARLARLTHLELFGIRPANKSLSDLESAPRLTSVRVSKYPKRETTRFYTQTSINDSLPPRPDVADWH